MNRLDPRTEIVVPKHMEQQIADALKNGIDEKMERVVIDEQLPPMSAEDWKARLTDRDGKILWPGDNP